jgi:hypothetical protein
MVSHANFYTITKYYSEALDDNKWHHTMQEDYDALLHNKTWHLVPPRPINFFLLLVGSCGWHY